MDTAAEYNTEAFVAEGEAVLGLRFRVSGLGFRAVVGPEQLEEGWGISWVLKLATRR